MPILNADNFPSFLSLSPFSSCDSVVGVDVLAMALVWRMTHRSQFAPSIVWVPSVRLGFSALVVSTIIP